MNERRDALQIHLFGGFSLAFDGATLPPLPSRHARLLFAWLVLQHGRAQPRSLLTDRFWPDLSEARARRRLSHALWQIQDGFGELGTERPYVLTPGDAVAFAAEAPYWLDVQEFEERLDAVDAAGAVDGVGMRHLRRVVELYHGDLLAGFYEPWVLREQDRLRQRHVTGLGRLVEACKQHGNFDEALTIARRLTHQAPLREDAHREVMRLCVLLGRPSQALEQFERCRSVLAEELGTSPSAETVALHERISETRDAGPRPPAPVEQLEARRMVGRDDERVRLVDHLERTLGGDAGVVFVEGEPGVGKSQLLAQAADDARWRGYTVLWGTCSGTDVPYAAVREALLPALDPVRVAQLRAHVEPVWLEQAARLLPPLRLRGATAPASTGTLAGSDGAQRMRDALAAVVTGLAAIEPVLLVLEDLHHADQDTLALLRTQARQADPGRILALVSFRDVDARADEEVWTALRQLDRDARPARVRLAPLTPFDTAALLREVLGAPHIPTGFVEGVHRECGGNPLYVLELLRSLRDSGSLTTRGSDHLLGLDVPVTDDLRTLIDRRFALLAPEARAVAELGAVLGSEFAFASLEAGSTDDARSLARVVGELARRNLLHLDDGMCTFTHAASRRVLLDGLDEDRARHLHLVAADALEATDPDAVEALAAHLLAAGERARALPHVRAAADRAVALFAHATAARHLETALALADEVPMPVDERRDLLLQAEQVLDVLGRREEQAAVLQRLAQVTASAADRVEVLDRQATHLGHVGRLTEAIDLAKEAVATVPAGEDGLRGRALATLAQVVSWAGDNATVVDVLGEAVPLLGDDPSRELRARTTLGTALRFLQRYDDADAELRAALATAEDVGDDVGRVLAIGALADLRAETGRADEAVDAYERAVELARQIGYRYREGVSLVNLATVRLLRAEPGASLVAYDEAMEVFRSLGEARGTAMVQLNRAWLRHRWLGRDDDARRDASAAHAYFVEIGADYAAATACETLAGIARRHGDLTRAHEWLTAGVDAAAASADQRAAVQLGRCAAELALAEDDFATARTAASTALEQARELGLEEFIGDLAATAALAAAQQGDVDAADGLADTATGWLAASSEPHRLHHRLAIVAERCGAPTTAEHHHRTALALLSEALTGVGGALADDARTAVPEHAAIVAAGAHHTPRRLHLTLARADAPRGRALHARETTDVVVDLGPKPTSSEARRAQLLDALRQIEEQGAEPTIGDLTATFDVSASTIRRDLRALRDEGHEATTRGSGTG